MGVDLPTVSEAFEADIGPFISAIHDARDAMLEAAAAAKTLQETIDSLHGKTIEIGIQAAGATGNVGDSAAGAAADVRDLAVAWTEEEVAQKAASAAAEAFGRDVAAASADFESFMSDRLHASMENLANDLYIQANSADQADLAFEHLRQGYQEAFAAQDSMTAGMDALRASLEGVDVETTALWDGITHLGPGFVVAAGGAKEAATAADKAAFSFRLWGTGIRITGTALHWIVAGSAEFLAVAVPAAVALGAGMLVAAQGAQMAQIHMSSLYTATEATANMFHETFGQALGMRSALQQAQDAANPGVYEVLGSAINAVKSNFQDLAGVGLQVVHVFDEFAARINVDLASGAGSQIHAMLSGMVTDLTEFGQILGNVGHAILNFAAAMPGLAAVLLAIATAASHFLLVVSSIPAPIITAVMALEEFYRWGGVALRMLLALGAAPAALVNWFQGANFIRAFGTSLATLAQYGGIAIQGIGRLVASMSGLIPAAEGAGAAVEAFGADMAIGAATMSPMLIAGIAGAVAALVGLIIVLGRSKSATDAWVASTDKAVQSAGDLKAFSLISADLAQNSIRMAAAQQQAATATDQFNKAATGGKYAAMGLAAGASTAERATQELASNQQFLSGTATNMIQNSIHLGEALHMTAGNALLLANIAGVNLQQSMARGSEAFKIAQNQILNLGQGYTAMGHNAGQVGNDMTAVAISAGLQATQVGKLTQAWDGYISLLTGGTTALATFEQGLQNIGTVAASSAGKLFEAQGTMNQSTEKFAASLQSFTGKSAQNWQNFNQIIGTGAQQFIDWMQNAGAVGMVSGNQMASAVKGIVLQLLPFASKSAAARAEVAGLAQEVGGPATTSLRQLKQWAAEGGMSAKQLGDFVAGTTVKLGDMANVAANLGTVLQGQLAAAFDAARREASGFNTNLASLASEISTHASPASTGYKTALNGVITSMAQMHVSVPVITAMVRSMGVNITQAGVAAIISAGHMNTLANAEANAGSRGSIAAGQVNGLARAIDGLQSKQINITVDYSAVGSAIGMGSLGGHTGTGPRASGGPVEAGGAYLVGERGPELFLPHTPGHVYSNPDSQHLLSGGGGFSGTINLTHTTHVHAQVDQSTLFDAVKTETARYAVRNGNPQQGRLAPGKI